MVAKKMVALMEAIVDTASQRLNVLPALQVQKPRALILPGVYGQDEQIIAFAKRCSAFFDVDIIELPPAIASTSVLTNMTATASVIAEQIISMKIETETILIGYSFGASLALEVMAEMTGSGHSITKIVVLDGPFENPVDRTKASHRGVAREAVGRLGSAPRIRGALLQMTDPMIVGARLSDPIQRAMLWHLRGKALDGWIPRGCDAEGLHVWTGSYGSANQERWAALCPRLRSVQVASAHHRLLADESLDTVVDLLRALMAPSRACPS